MAAAIGRRTWMERSLEVVMGRKGLRAKRMRREAQQRREREAMGYWKNVLIEQQENTEEKECEMVANENDRGLWPETEAVKVTPLFRQEMVVEERTITPVLAAEWLAHNTRNRTLNAEVAAAYARDMAAGNWRSNGETIKFSRSGVLLDGQHRLAAVVRACVPVQSFVIFGLPDDAFSTIDTGKKRSMGDVLTVQGEPNATTLAAAAVNLWRYEHGWLFRGSGNALRAPTHAEQAEIIEKHPGLRVSAVKARVSQPVLAPGQGTVLHYLFSHRDREMADLFFERLAKGENLPAGEPVLVLRNRLLENRASRLRMPAFYPMVLTVKAWNATRQGRRLSIIKTTDVEIERLVIV